MHQIEISVCSSNCTVNPLLTEVMESDNAEAVKATCHIEECRYEKLGLLARILIMSWWHEYYLTSSGISA